MIILYRAQANSHDFYWMTSKDIEKNSANYRTRENSIENSQKSILFWQRPSIFFPSKLKLSYKMPQFNSIQFN